MEWYQLQWGGEINDYKELAPPNSFIHVDNFTSPEHLADYLKHLDEDPGEYEAYHSWRQNYEIKETGGWWWWWRKDNLGLGDDGLWCQACKAAHHAEGQDRQVSLRHSAWNDQSSCRNNDPGQYKLPPFTEEDDDRYVVQKVAENV